MQKLPHHYKVAAQAPAEGTVRLRAEGLPDLETAPPAEYGGPGDRWSPETLLVGAVADCFILTFRAIARASKLEWHELACDAEGVLDRADGKTRFVELSLQATLRVPADTDRERAHALLEKAERSCIITNSLHAECKLSAQVEAASS